MKTLRFTIAAFVAMAAQVSFAQENEVTDSVLVVRDSVIVQGETFMRGDASAARDFTVDGNTILNANVTINNGSLKLPYLEDPAVHGDQVLTIGDDGEVKSNDLVGLVYKDNAPAQVPCLYDANGDVIPWNPQWVSIPGVLYTSSKCNPDVRVGIGTNQPDARFHINLDELEYGTPAMVVTHSTNHKLFQLNADGLGLMRELKLNVEAWPDYVFDETYQLLPLDQLGEYIANNNHLPNVPSACEMEEQGVNVSETSVLLMEKVEELTLYLIELQKQLNAQQALIQEQQKIIEALQQ